MMKYLLLISLFMMSFRALSEDVAIDQYKTTLPDQIGNLKFKQLLDYETKKKGLGQGYIYSNDKSLISIYIYNKNHKEIKEGIEDKLVKDTLEQFKKSLNKMGKNEKVKDMKIEDMDKELKVAIENKYLGTTFSYTVKSASQKSYFFIRGHENNFLKIHASFEITDGKYDNSGLSAVLDAIDKNILNKK